MSKWYGGIDLPSPRADTIIQQVSSPLVWYRVLGTYRMKQSKRYPGRGVVRPLQMTITVGAYNDGRDNVAPAYLSVRELPIKRGKVM